MERLGMRQEAHFVDSTLRKGAWSGELVYAMLQREWRT
jgi:RimJ/RimL family protein N-acetyltransferase